jgi:hypothetical protein
VRKALEGELSPDLFAFLTCAERPFARDLLFPRLATCNALKALQSGPTFTVIEGAPVTGKTCLSPARAAVVSGEGPLKLSGEQVGKGLE